MDTMEKIHAMDERYRRRTAGLGGNLVLKNAYEVNKSQTCWWPKCEGEAVCKGMCVPHYRRLVSGTLLTPGLKEMEKPEALGFAKRFVAAADVAGVSPEDLMRAAMVTAIEQAERQGAGES